jgi:uncharacterized membrane protein
MIFTTEVWIRIILCVLGIIGYSIARHIHTKKTQKKPIVCPLRMNCHAVLHSDYSKFMGVPLEVFGMIYYALISLSYLLLVFSPLILPPTFVSILVIFSLGAFIFSLYLIFVQIFILKEGCFWCYISALTSSLIFLITVFAYDVVGIVHALMK